MIKRIHNKKYNIKIVDKNRDSYMIENNCVGWCDCYSKEIRVAKHELKQFEKATLRHELIHAFLFECGVENGYSFHNEEAVNFLSHKIEDIYKMFKECDCLEEI